MQKINTKMQKIYEWQFYWGWWKLGGKCELWEVLEFTISLPTK